MHKLTIIVVLIFLSNCVQAQYPSRIFSPYAQGNLGYLGGDYYSKNFGMANTGIAKYHQNSVNLKNPALLSYNKFTILEPDIAIRMDEFQVDTSLKRQSSGGFNGIHLVMPLSYKWTTAISLTPVSSSSFGASSKSAVEGISGDTLFQNDSTFGGIQQIRWANGFTVAKGLNLGAELDYSFGNITEQRATRIEGVTNTQYLFEKTSSKHHGLEYKLGASYHKEIIWQKGDPEYVQKKDTLYVLNGKKKRQVSRQNITENDVVTDTIISVDRDKIDRKIKIGVGAIYKAPYSWKQESVSVINNNYFGSIDTTEVNIGAPSKLGFGLSVGNTGYKNVWSLAVDYEIQNWSEFTVNDINQNLKNSSRLSAGLIYTPEVQSESFFKKTSYSIGGYKYKTPYMYNGAQLDEVGMHFGISFVDRAKRTNESSRWREKSPERMNALTRYNVGVGVGMMGGNETSAIQQTFIKFNLGISLNSEWFIRRKIN